MTPDQTQASWVTWRDTNWTVADRADDIRGRRVLDPDGEEVGEIEDLLIDTQERKVRLLQVASGGVLGLGATTFLLPVEAITRISEEAVQIDQRRERIVGAPPYDPALVDQPSWHDLYGHYGYAPYWAATGVYPPYPSIPLGHSVLIGEALTGRTQTFLSRVLQGLIAGIGFLLAGTILKQQAVGLGREASAVLGTVLAFMILVLLPQVRPYTDTDETRREDTGALQQTAVRAHDKRGQSTP